MKIDTLKNNIAKYVFVVIMAILIVVPTAILMSGFSGCARVYYKDSTPSIKCNFALMLIKLKSIKGNESFEVGQFIRDCYNDLNVIYCRDIVYGDKKVEDDENKKLEFLQCLKENR